MTRWLTLGYYRGLRKSCHAHPESRRDIQHCRRCRIRFLTGRGNLTRTDIDCVFGCRKERIREKTKERGRRHYRTDKGRHNKGARNRARSLMSAGGAKNEKAPGVPGSSSAYHFRPELLRYIAYLLKLACDRKPPVAEIERFLQDAVAAVMRLCASCAILRQRSLPGRGG